MVVDFYEILEISPTAGAEEIRAAVTGQRRIWVRRQSSADPDRRTAAEQRVRQIDQAEKTLLDPAARRTYDRQLAEDHPSPHTVSAVPVRREPSGGHPRTDGVDDQLRAANRYLEQGKWPLALAAYEEVREREPDNVAAAEGIAAAYVGSGRVKEGLAVLEQAVADHPDDESAKSALATQLYETAIAGLGRDPGPTVTSRRQLRLVVRHRRRIRKLGLRDRRTVLLMEQLRDIASSARRPVWRPSRFKRYYLMLFLGSALLTVPGSTFAYAAGGFWMAAIIAVYLVRHRVPGWKYRRRSGRGGPLPSRRKGF